MASLVRSWLQRLTADDTVVDADELSFQSHRSGCQQAAECWQGQKVTVLGRLRTVDLRPVDALATVSAELYDGTDAVELIWLGRRSIPGVATGRTLRATGRLAVRDGHKAMYNPDYQLLCAHA